MSKYPITLKQKSKDVTLGNPGGYDTNNPYIACRNELIGIAKRIVFNGQPVSIYSANGDKMTIDNGKDFLEWILDYYQEGREYGFYNDVKEELTSHFQ